MYITLLIIGIGLSMDAFSVAITNGLCIGHATKKDALKIAAFFGIAQGIMPLAGYFAGLAFSAFVERVDHWIAFVILSIIGIKMIIEAVEKIKKPEECTFCALSTRELFFQAVATSIDALAVGISFAALEFNIFTASAVIAATTFFISFVGVFIGKKVGNIFKEKAEIFGGAVLVLIGIKILIEHLFF